MIKKEINMSCEERDGLMYLFSYKDRDVRTVVMNGEPWWVLGDICKVLGYTQGASQTAKKLNVKNVRRLVLPHRHYEKAPIVMICVNESGLLELILGSEKPWVHDFRQWVLGEVFSAMGIEKEIAEENAPKDYVKALTDLTRRVEALESKMNGDIRKAYYLDRTNKTSPQPVTVQMVS